MIFETHAHYDDDRYEEDRDELISSLKDKGIGAVCNVSSEVGNCDKTIELIEKYDFFYGTIGVHPSYTGELNEENFAHLCELARHEKIVAIGEIGFDYYYDEPEKSVQREWFLRQLSLARELKLPVVIHSREAAADTMEVIKGEHVGDLGGVVHCYSYSVEHAREYASMGLYIGIGGVLTFKNAKKLKEVVEDLPLERIVLETDCPYLAPVPHRGERNSSLYLPYVVEEIARIKGVSTKEVEQVTFENAKKLYRIEV